jgi:DNA modification methylase
MREKENNRLNSLNGKEWVKLTKSIWHNITNIKDYTKIENAIKTGILFSMPPPRDELTKMHPATFSDNDVAKLIRFFTKEKEIILDPFMGTGSSGVASVKESRNFIGIELYECWYNIAKKRVENIANNQVDVKLYCSDSYEIVKSIKDNSIDLIVTSPPYWGILNKVDHKAKKRVNNGLNTNYGSDKRDLSNIESYSDFLKTLELHFIEYYRILKPRKYVAIIVSDFRHKQKYYMFHSDIANSLESVGFTLQGLVILVQDNKKLYPYGYPTTYVPNISNQFIVLVRKI